MLLAAIVGSRLLFVHTNLGDFAVRPLDAFALWKGRLVLFAVLCLLRYQLVPVI